MAAARGDGLRGPLLGGDGTVQPQGAADAARARRGARPWAALAIAAALLALAGALLLLTSGDKAGGGARLGLGLGLSPHEVESGAGAVAADDARCSEVGAAALRAGGHAVDAAVAAALCLGVVHPMSSGLGGGAFLVVRDAASGHAVAFDARETAPAAATPDMYAADPSAKSKGPLAMGVPGELAGLHAAWSRYGRLPWRDLVAPAARLARDGYEIVAYVAGALRDSEADVLADPGLRAVFAPEGRVLEAGETCRNPALADALERVAEEGAAAFYGGAVGESFVRDVRAAGGIVTVEDLRGYEVEVSGAMRADAMGYTFLGMPPPSSGTVGMALILNVLGGYKSLDFLNGFLGIHRLIEAIKHMLAIRMNLGDPDFVNVTGDVAKMLSPALADRVRQRIVDNTTFPPGYYLPKWAQLDDHGTSHLCVVDGDRNAVALTTTVNSFFGAKVLSPSTGIVANNEMDDFSVPAKRTPDQLPPAPANFIAPGKRPLSSMTPLVILKNGQLVGVLGGSGGTNIIATVTQVFLNHFIVGMDPMAAVQRPRVYHKLIPNVVSYENETVVDGDVIALNGAAQAFLEQRGHQLQSTDSGAVCQFIVQELAAPDAPGGGSGGVFRGRLTAVSDPRKGGSPAGL
ncbi:hypothetical protein BS78_03G063600 [Paspalum vaginatum]|nr:hypothetical protein BS78_03G063600 [Paspalum vaginatum]